jgi:hypothetical protein
MESNVGGDGEGDFDSFNSVVATLSRNAYTTLNRRLHEMFQLE